MSQLPEHLESAKTLARELDGLKSPGDVVTLVLTKQEARDHATALHALTSHVERMQQVLAYEAEVVEAQTPEKNYMGTHRKTHMLGVAERLRQEALGIWADRHHRFTTSLERLIKGGDS